MALSEMLTEAVRVPPVVGVKITLMVQLPPAARDVPHVLLCAKSLGFVPAIAMLVILKVALPLLLKATV